MRAHSGATEIDTHMPLEISKPREVAEIAPAESQTGSSHPEPQPTEALTPERTEEPPQPTEAQKEDAFKKLKRSMATKVIEKSDLIANSLIEATIKGNSNSARIVVGLVDKRRKTRRQLKALKRSVNGATPRHSVTFDLAESPEWDDDDDGKPIRRAPPAPPEHAPSDPAPSDPAALEVPQEKETHDEAHD